jgi:glycosyltransferase involved in cell wall biosynthesis
MPASSPIIRGLGANEPKRGKVLISWVTDPFMPGYDLVTSSAHVHDWQCKEMVAILGDAGFGVDVIDWMNTRDAVNDNYDLIIGLGDAFVKSCRRQRRDIPSIYLGTGMDSKLTNELIEERSRILFERRGIKIEQPIITDDGPLIADEIWYIGNDSTRDSYRVPNVALNQLPNTVLDSVLPTFSGKDFLDARNHFMWMAAHGAIRRSLDVLLEVFEGRPNQHLWVCGLIDREHEFFAFYRKQLLELKNIHYVGWVKMASEKYQEVTRRCGYILYPTVSDGMPGSVVNAMAAGVVPIVTDAAGMDCGGFGQRIPRIDHATLANLVVEAAAIDPSELARQSEGGSTFAFKRYSKEAFRKAFRDLLSKWLPTEA